MTTERWVGSAALLQIVGVAIGVGAAVADIGWLLLVALAPVIVSLVLLISIEVRERRR